jgi:hypothetical protein
MQTVHYRRWTPQKSPVRIEFPPALLREIRNETTQDHDRGYLFGIRRGDDVQVLAARRAPQSADPGLSGMEPLGLYISRFRGEVFLTDSDLEQFERLNAEVALVVAGSRAGFFVRELDGTVQAIRSHEEFWIADVSAVPKSLTRAPGPSPSGPHPWIPPMRPWKWAAAMLALLAGPVAGLGYLGPLLPQAPLHLTLRETNGQLVVEWDRQTAQAGGWLEIADRSGRSVLAVPPGSTSTTYVHHNGDVEVRFSTTGGTGTALWRAPRIYGRPFDQRAGMAR